MGIQSYRDLKVWQEGMNLAEQGKGELAIFD